MQWKNTETPTFAGNSGTGITGPNVVETFELKDRSGVALATLTKSVEGVLSHDLPLPAALGSTPAEVDQLNDISAYQESVIADGALSVAKVYSGLSLTDAGAVTLAAPDGSMLGQLKTIEMIDDNGDVTLLLTNVVGQTSGTTATFGDVGDVLVLLAAFGKWVVIKELGIGLA